MNPAFAYIYDECLSDRRFERDLGLIETELARRGIEGRIIRLAMFRQPRDVIFELARGSVKNLIFVGNDQTLEQMACFLPDVNLTIGYLPMVPSKLAPLLGIPDGVGAVDVLAARLVDHLDMGKINDRYFLTEVVVPETRAALEIEGRYRMSPHEGGAIAIRNLAGASLQGGGCARPEDGLLEGVIQARVATGARFWKRHTLSESRVYFQEGKIIADKKVQIFVDGFSMQGNSFSLSILPKKIRMITGKQKAWQELIPTGQAAVAGNVIL